MTLFQDYLEKNKDTFLTFSIEEISDQAVAYGFSQTDVDQWLKRSNWDRRKVV